MAAISPLSRNPGASCNASYVVQLPKLVKPQVPCARLHTERGHTNYFVIQFPSEQLIIRTLDVNLLPSSSRNSCTSVADRIVKENISAR